MKKKFISFILTACVLAGGCGTNQNSKQEPETIAETAEDEKPDSKEQKEESNQIKARKNRKQRKFKEKENSKRKVKQGNKRQSGVLS